MTLAVAATVDLNKAHEQALELWAKITEKQERQLTCLFANELEQSIRFYDFDTYSEKCSTVEGMGGIFDDQLPTMKTAMLGWKGHQRIACVASFFVDALSGDDPKYDANIRKYARNVIIFSCYSLVSRQGQNHVVVSAESYGGAFCSFPIGSSFAFDYGKSDGGLSSIKDTYGDLLLSRAEVALSNDSRHQSLSNFAKQCYAIDRSKRTESFTADCLSVDGRGFEISASISGRFDCTTNIHIRTKR
jgi:hypothetical protein